jgi:hypothetical protein
MRRPVWPVVVLVILMIIFLVIYNDPHLPGHYFLCPVHYTMKILISQGCLGLALALLGFYFSRSEG